jgi:hypothetical protein
MNLNFYKGSTLTENNSANIIQISRDLIPFDSSWNTLSKVFWVQHDQDNGRVAKRPKTACYASQMSRCAPLFMKCHQSNQQMHRTRFWRTTYLRPTHTHRHTDLATAGMCCFMLLTSRGPVTVTSHAAHKGVVQSGSGASALGATNLRKFLQKWI